MRLAPLLTVIAALMLAVLPLPAAVAGFRPDWVAVLFIFWALTAPPALGFLAAVGAGIALDTLTGALIGQHAFALVIITYLSRRFRLQLRAFPVSQLILAVAALLALYEFLLFWIDGAAGRTVPGSDRWAAVLSGAVVWAAAWALADHGRDPTPTRL